MTDTTDHDALIDETDALADAIGAIDLLSLAMIYADKIDLHSADDILNDRFIRDCIEWADDSPECLAALRRGIEIELLIHDN